MKKISINKQLLIIFFFALLLRLLFLNWNTAEYSDGIRLMTMFNREARGISHWPPLYAFLIQVCNFLLHDLELSGKLISIITGALVVFPIFLIGKRVYGERAGLYAAILYTVAPVALRWNIRVMSDSLLALLFLLSLYYLFEFRCESDKKKRLILSIFLGGLAASTHYRGLAILPLLFLIYAGYAIRYRKILPTLLGWISWLILPLWWRCRGFPWLSIYQEQLGKGWFETNPLIHAEMHLLNFPYILTYPVFILVCYGLFKSKRSNVSQKFFLQVFGFLLIVHFLAISMNTGFFASRHWITMLPLFLILAAYGLTLFERRGKILLAGCVLVSFIFSMSVLYLQRDTYGDIKRSTIYIRDHLKGETIFSDEVRRTGFWAETPISMFDLQEIRPGSYVVLHSFFSKVVYPIAYPNISRQIETFLKDYKLEKIYETKSEIVPLLPDIMSLPPLTNHPGWMTMKYQKQYFNSVIFKVEGMTNKSARTRSKE